MKYLSKFDALVTTLLSGEVCCTILSEVPCEISHIAQGFCAKGNAFVPALLSTAWQDTSPPGLTAEFFLNLEYLSLE